MKFSITLIATATGLLVSATPLAPSAVVDVRDEGHALETRQTASGCIYFASPHCCVPTVCMCPGDRFYYVNRDNIDRGLHGCDPPWGFFGFGYPSYPGSCCRVAEDGAVEKVEEDGSILTVEASPLRQS
ncbi:hypothetical protein SAMD00023353_0403570 [Rosellinia necatrix]|uniref:Small secreted protein n=1 Tax=Rosellinia necatrix TaxID=77044 RepID=A0A1S8A5E2_ROSNE|nr:hypothetical protein SAMD00023353_0403570 [Rosellinia necatrix]